MVREKKKLSPQTMERGRRENTQTGYSNATLQPLQLGKKYKDEELHATGS